MEDFTGRGAYPSVRRAPESAVRWLPVARIAGRSAVWLAHRLWEPGVGSSNLPVPTISAAENPQGHWGLGPVIRPASGRGHRLVTNLVTGHDKSGSQRSQRGMHREAWAGPPWPDAGARSPSRALADSVGRSSCGTDSNTELGQLRPRICRESTARRPPHSKPEDARQSRSPSPRPGGPAQLMFSS